MSLQVELFEGTGLVKSIEGYPKIDIVNRGNCQRLNHFFIITRKYGKPRADHWRRNGKTILWKTRPHEFKIPVKFGLYDYGYITHLNINVWGSV